ncbi:MAG: hypothetical protein ACRBFS_00610 [Aureispira sp.]
MPKLTYRSIQPYLVAQEIDEDTLHCTFEVEEERFESSATIVAMDKKVDLGRLVSNPSRVRSMLGQVLKRTIGKNKGLVAQKKISKTSHSTAALKIAAIRAFEGILDQVVYMETTDKWHLVTQFSSFEVFLRQHPLRERYDKKVMARMLVEIARADGRITEQERLFFKHFLNEDTGRLSVLMQAPVLVQQDCVKVSPHGRETVFLVVAAAALADYRIQEEEEEKLLYYANLFGFDQDRRRALLVIAQEYTLELAIKTDLRLWSEKEVIALAEQMKCPLESALKVYQRQKENQEGH